MFAFAGAVVAPFRFGMNAPPDVLGDRDDRRTVIVERKNGVVVEQNCTGNRRMGLNHVFLREIDV